MSAVCAWCHPHQPGEAPVSHGICAKHLAEMMASDLFAKDEFQECCDRWAKEEAEAAEARLQRISDDEDYRAWRNS